MKYGILLYKETDNIGDDIQTYTAKRFLPHIDYIVEREELNNFIPNEKEYVSVIMNGWYLHNKSNWPPSPYINPLLHSAHFTTNNTTDVGDVYLQDIGGEYLRKFEPIGCRDYGTVDLLEQNNIKNYFSGCMTTTIEKFDNVEKQDYICLVDLDENINSLIKSNTDRKIYEMTHHVNPDEIENKSFEERMNDVEKILKTYQGAHLVITSRLHVALPCLALGTPIIFIHKENYEEHRLKTYVDYLNSYVDTEFEQENIKDILENPKENKKDYLKIRKPLIKKCKEFIEACETGSYDVDNLPDIEVYKKELEKTAYYKALYREVRKKSEKLCMEKEEFWNEKQKIWNERVEAVNYLENQCKQKDEQLNEIYNSRGWKLINKFKKLKN